METQIVIIGAGLMGTMIARELSRYDVDVIVVEKEPDVGMGETKASNGMIYTGLMWLASLALKSIATEGSSGGSHAIKEEMCLRGFEGWEAILQELDVPYSRDDLIVIGRNEDELKRLEHLRAVARPEWDIRLLDRGSLFELEPNITPEAGAALYGKGHILTNYPWDIVMALAENAKANGIRFMLETEVQRFSRRNGSQIVATSQGPIKTEFVVNAAGPWASHVAALAGIHDFTFKYFKRHGIIMDRRAGRLVNNCVLWPPTPGVSKVVHPMISGNLRLGSIYGPAGGEEDKAAEKEGLETVFRRATDLVPALSRNDIIAHYTGIRIFSNRDPEEYIVEFASRNPRFINVVLSLPGFAPSPVIAAKVLGLLEDAGLELTVEKDFNPRRARIPAFRELSSGRWAELIEQDPRWGNMICRCESVTEAEIIEAIRRGAQTVAGVKYRTRAGMGRCQTNFCGTRLAGLIAPELDIPLQTVRYKSAGSYYAGSGESFYGFGA